MTYTKKIKYKSCFYKQGIKELNEKKRALIIGCGKFFQTVHLENIKKFCLLKF